MYNSRMFYYREFDIDDSDLHSVVHIFPINIPAITITKTNNVASICKVARSLPKLTQYKFNDLLISNYAII